MNSFASDSSEQSRDCDGHNDIEGQDPHPPPSPSHRLLLPPLPLPPQTAAVPNIDSLRLPGRGDLINSKNTLQSHSVAELEQAATESTVWHNDSIALDSLEVHHGSSADSPMWTGFYKQVHGIIGRNAATGQPEVRNVAAVPEATGTFNVSGLESADIGQDDGSKNAMRFDSIFSSSSSNQTTTNTSGAIPTTNNVENVNVATASPGTIPNDDVQEGYSTGVLVHAYLADEDESKRFTAFSWIMLLCAGLIVIATVILASLYVSTFNESTIAPETTTPPSQTADNRATRLTDFINDIKLSNTTLSVPLQGIGPVQAVDGEITQTRFSSSEQAALAWLVHDDPLNLIPDTQANQFRLKQRYALLTLYLQFPVFAESTFTSTDDECTWPIVGTCEIVTMEQVAIASVTGIATKNVSAAPGLTLSLDLGLLSNLMFFSVVGRGLVGRGLVGSLSSSLGTSWTNLATFEVNDNQLAGSLPSLLGTMWTNLTWFDVSSNALTGSIPSTLGNTWTNLAFFYVEKNALTGTLPNLAIRWSNLFHAYFNNNSLVGSIPNGFCTNATVTTGRLVADCGEVTCDCCSSCCRDEITGDCE